MTAAPVSVVVVAYHGSGDLDRCLGPVAELRPIVVDNSSDQAVRAVAERHGARYIDAGGNRGYAAGVNIGAAYAAPCADLLLLNPDAVMTARDVERLTAYLHEDPAIAAVAPQVRDPSGAQQRVGWPFPAPMQMWLEAAGWRRMTKAMTEYVIGPVLLIRRAAWDEIGGFDERFFLYAEETDWQRRATLRGWQLAGCDDVTVNHRGAGTSDDPAYRELLFHAAAETYGRKWFGAAGWASYRAAAMVGAALRARVGPADTRARARERWRIYRTGPVKALRAYARPT